MSEKQNKILKIVKAALKYVAAPLVLIVIVVVISLLSYRAKSLPPSGASEEGVELESPDL